MSSEQPDPKTSRRNRSLRVLFGIVVLGGVLIYALHFAPPNPLQALLSGPARPLPKPVHVDAAGELSEAVQDPITLLDARYGIGFDKRIADGLQSAIKQYLEYTIRNANEATVTYQAESAEHGLYQINYTYKHDKLQGNVTLPLATDADAVQSNLKNAVEVFRGVTRSIPPTKGAAQKVATDSVADFPDERLKQLHNDIARFDPYNMFKVLLDLETEVSTGKAGIETLLGASEIYSWLAFFKNALPSPALGHFLAQQATTYYIMGASRQAPDPRLDFYTGLLLLAMDYPGAALETFEQDADQTSWDKEVLAAFIRSDFEKLRSLAGRSMANKRLMGYLLARTYTNAYQYFLSDEQLKRVLRDYPDFLFAKEFAAYNGGVGVSRRFASEHILDVFEKHLQIMGTFLQTDPITNQAEVVLKINQEVSKEDVVEKWLSIHKKLASSVYKKKHTSRILPIAILREYLSQGIQSSLLAYYRLQADKLAVNAEAARIIKVINAAYGDAAIAQAMGVDYRYQHGQRDAVLSYVNRLNQGGKDAFLSETILKVLAYYGKTSHRLVPRATRLLMQHQQRINPNFDGLMRCHDALKRMGYRKYALDCLRQAAKANPYSPRLYAALRHHTNVEAELLKGKAFLNTVPSYYSSLARWHEDNDRPDDAIQNYQKATALDAGAYEAHLRLGDLYKKKEQYEEAISVWKRYLDTDDQTLSAVVIKNRIGYALLKQNKIKAAYEIFESAKESGQAGALMGFAEVSERKGRMLQAEQYFQRTADRYPTGYAPKALIKFYLRQNDPDTAIAMIAKYKRNRSYSYYYAPVVEFFGEKGKPYEAVTLIRRVESDNKDGWALYSILPQLIKRGYYEEAAKLALELVKDTQTFNGSLSYNAALRFLEAQDKGQLKTTKAEFDSILKRYRGKRHLIEPFTARLNGQDYHTETFKAARYWREKTSPGRWEPYLIMAQAWRMGDKKPEEKSEILGYLPKDKQHDNPWYRQLTLFLLEEVDEKTLRRMIRNQQQYCEFYYLLGRIRYHEGHKEDAARYLMASLETRQAGNIEYRYAWELLSRIGNAAN